MQQHAATCPQHPQHVIAALLADWRAAADPMRHACADDLTRALHGLGWLPPTTDTTGASSARG
jgi:hypothetical protein